MAAETILILGASVRAAAQSAVRAGFAPFGIDLFADRDLQATCPCIRVDPADYPHGLFAAADRAPPGPWMYTGGLENYPDLIDALAAKRPLWGNAGDGLRCVRDPFALHRTLSAAGFAPAEVRATPNGLPTDGSWLVKPIRSGGGRGIARWTGQTPPGEPHLFQKFADGEPVSALFVGDGESANLVGVSEQIIGAVGLNAPSPFAYCGNVGPLYFGARLTIRLRRLGRLLAAEFGLRGLFGVDAVRDGDQITVIEVNPRTPASAEIVEHSGMPPLIEQHRLGCVGRLPDEPAKPWYGPYAAKLVVYAARDWTMPNTDEWLRSGNRADIPQTGEIIPAGQPAFTWLDREPSLERILRPAAGSLVKCGWLVYADDLLRFGRQNRTHQ